MTSAPRKPTSALKIVLIVLAAVVGLGLLGVLVCVGSGYLWVQQNAPALREGAEHARSEAQSFAAGHSQADCMEEGLRRHDTCGQGMAISCRTQARIFTDICLDEATPTPGLCDGVPPPMEIMAGAQWAVRYCADHGRAQDQQCGNFVRALVEHCGRAR